MFAPTNDAFNALPAGVLANLLKPENKAQLVAVLTYHVISGDVYSYEVCVWSGPKGRGREGGL